MQIILTITTFLTFTSVILTSNSDRTRNKNIRDRERDDRRTFLSRDWTDFNGNSGDWRRDGREDSRFNENERIRRSDRSRERERGHERERDRDRDLQDIDKRIGLGRGRDRPEYKDPDSHKINPKLPKYPINTGGEPNKIISPPPFFPFPTEPLIPMMPSIIKPYPVIESQLRPSSYVVVPPNYYSSSAPSEYHPIVTVSPIYSAEYSQKPEVYYTTSLHSNAYTTSYSSYYPISSSIAKKVPIYYNSTSSSSIHYASTYIKTEAESTVTTKVTGRYRAMSNSSSSSSSSSQNSNIAGSISFCLVLFSSLFLLILV